MIEGKKVLVLIPARGGSKGVPRKNLLDIDGKSITHLSVDCAKGAKYVDEVVVSTDDDEIAKHIESHAKVILRPKELATDTAKMSAVVGHVAQELANEGFSYIVLLQPTSPFRKSETVDRAIEEFHKNKDDFDSLIPLKKNEPKIGTIDGLGKYQKMFKLDMQRQEMQDIYAECGAVFVYKCENALAGDNIGKHLYPFIVTDILETIEIDDVGDVAFVRAIWGVKK